ncbi:hypothetical protein CEXT_23951 [Caerostris extrusa]|uniref:Uncharacterized protein n=1 Tax=Caerostris extrusa TaxID=172846 RepID=A0AAV4NYA2_CAEEX|nr:hypothetical protein CEXT_23951 [Caerostris extrusa]
MIGSQKFLTEPTSKLCAVEDLPCLQHWRVCEREGAGSHLPPHFTSWKEFLFRKGSPSLWERNAAPPRGAPADRRR